MKNDIVICGIETSCDETSAAVVRNGTEVLSNIIYSQVGLHKKYGGIVPEVASREHVEKIGHIFLDALETSGLSIEQIDRYAVTYAPGLAGALLVGTSFAKALAYAQKKPLSAVNHLHGHIYSVFLQHNDLKPPFICLVVSGGHTLIADFKDHDDIVIIGRTRDDAAGEVFDKVARKMGLGYPGGPVIDKLASHGRRDRYVFPKVTFDDNIFDFSFSGPKTAIINFLSGAQAGRVQYDIEDVCASFQSSICDILVEKAVMACVEKKYDKLCIAGGVAANTYLRQSASERCAEKNLVALFPDRELCTDNAAMIAAAAFYSKKTEQDYLYLNPVADLKHIEDF